MKIWVHEVLWCKYESSWSVVSLHTTMKGAYKAMRQSKLAHYEKQRSDWYRYGRSIAIERGIKIGYKKNDRERIRAIKVRDD